jgi:hypothetical protein
MDPSEHTRCTASKPVMVILTFPSNGIYPLIGPLVDISRSELCFTYLPLQDIEIPIQAQCEVVLKHGFRSFSDPIPCKIVYEKADSPRGFSLMVPVRRCGIQFITPLRLSEIESICSESPDSFKKSVLETGARKKQNRELED